MHIFMNEVKDDLMTRKFLLDIRTKQKKFSRQLMFAQIKRVTC